MREFEKTGYFGYLFYISYNGQDFYSFDENPNVKSVKSEFRKLLEHNNIPIYKGIQQAGRTDKDVNAIENILYINSKKYIEYRKLLKTEIGSLKILRIERTVPFLDFPNMIEQRHYVYTYPTDLILNSEDKIMELCEKLSGNKDFSTYTNDKGKKLQQHVRNVVVKYINGELHFIGDSFLPQQVRIMSGFILTNKKKTLDGKYLTLKCVKKSDELEQKIFYKNDQIEIENVYNIEQNSDYIIFFVKKNKKAELIGKNGKNIRKIRSEYGNVIVKEVL